MQKPESKFKVKVLEKLRAIPDSWWTSVNQISYRGTPDILGCIQGRFIALELKSTSRGVVTKLQEHTLEKIKTCGRGEAYIVHPDNFEIILNDLKNLGVRNDKNYLCGSLESRDSTYPQHFIPCGDEFYSELELDEVIATIREGKERVE